MLIKPGDGKVTYVALGQKQRLPAWPPGKELSPRRDPRLAAWDRTSAAPAISWRIEFSVAPPDPPVADFAQRYLDALKQQQHVESVRPANSPVQSADIAAVMTIIASTLFDAQDRFESAMQEAWKQISRSRPHRPKKTMWRYSALMPAPLDTD